MKPFRRFKDIVNSNISSALDKAENPEKMIRYMITEMEDTLVELKSSCAAKMADRTRVEQERAELKAAAERWSNRAELAVEKGKDELAREALVERQKAQRTLQLVEEELVKLDAIISECKSNTIALEEKLQSVKDKQRILIQRGIHAQETILTREKIKEATGNEAFRRFSDLESKIEKMEAEAEVAGLSVPTGKEDEFFTMEQEDAIEAELEALKKSKAKSK